VSSNSSEDHITVEGNVSASQLLIPSSYANLQERDRNNLTVWHNDDALIQTVAAVNKDIVVVVNSVGPLTVGAWIEHPNATAVL
jgi:beta-glucosidase